MNPITLEQYVGVHANSPDWTPARRANAEVLLERVNAALDELQGCGAPLSINPHTGNYISGRTFGGFRPQSCPQGRPGSSHKEGQGIDIADPDNILDDHIDDEFLTLHGLYREHPDDTDTWVHLTTRAPGSGRRTFKP